MYATEPSSRKSRCSLGVEVPPDASRLRAAPSRREGRPAEPGRARSTRPAPAGCATDRGRPPPRERPARIEDRAGRPAGPENSGLAAQENPGQPALSLENEARAPGSKGISRNECIIPADTRFYRVLQESGS